MTALSRLTRSLHWWLLAAGVLTACSGQRFTHLDPTEDMGAQPGLLSREKGYFEFSIDMPVREE